MSSSRAMWYDRDYWKLDGFRYTCSEDSAKRILEKFGYTLAVSKSYSKKARLRPLQRARALSERGFQPYHSLLNHELRHLIDERNVMLRLEKGQIRSRNRLINALEENDEDRSFHGLLKLPAELRLWIYELYYQDFGGGLLDKPEQPPLTVTCRQIRAEALPLFYATHTFVLGFGRLYSDVRRRMELSKASDRWLRNISSHIEHIQRFQISVLSSRYGFGEPLVTISVNLDKTANVRNRVQVVSLSRLRTHQNTGREYVVGPKTIAATRKACLEALRDIGKTQGMRRLRMQDITKLGRVLESTGLGC